MRQILGGSPYQANTVMKMKEDLLQQKELVIDRQKQQIAQLHQRIAQSELRVQQVIQRPHGNYEDPYLIKLKESQYEKSPLQAHLSGKSKAVLYENGELEHKLAAAQLQVLNLHDFLKQNTHKYTEEIQKLEEKLKTREKYISSVKKKCQKESEQNQEKQQRIETLEKYLADLPSLDDIQTQAQQLEVLQETSHKLQETVRDLEERLGKSRALVKEKEEFLKLQRIKEKELIDAVQRYSFPYATVGLAVRLPLYRLPGYCGPWLQVTKTENINSEDSLATKLSEVCQLRKDIDELRTIISDGYAQDMGDNCITQ
ncbi:UNVERIFIED_CONTAM: hypothetical protein FKN15_012497 [Acipenser sinensis]